MHKAKRILIILLATLCMGNNCFALVASADDDSSSSSVSDDIDADAQANAENKDDTTDAEVKDPTATISDAEKGIVEKFNDSQKEAYGILTNKYMTHQDIQAMKWNLVLSQFAVPYRENIQDVLDQKIFKEMADANDGSGLKFNSNPYINAVSASVENGVASSSVLNEYLDAIIEGGSSLNDALNVEKYNFKTIADTLREDDNVQYTMVYNSQTNDYAFVTDLFSKSETSSIYFYIKDKIAFTGDAMEKDGIPAKLKAMNEQYLTDGENATKKKLAEDITSGCEVMDIQYPVYANTNSTMLYNAIFVSNAIRMGAYGTYDKFMNSLGNSQLYMDRWGNLCAQARINGTLKFVIVYPAYANPLLISSEVDDDDMAGYAYTDFNCNDFWYLYGRFKYDGDKISKRVGINDTGNWGNIASSYKELAQYFDGSLNDLATNRDNIMDNAWDDSHIFGVVGINPEKVAKTYKDIKSYVSSDGWTADSVDKNTWYGGAIDDSNTVYHSYNSYTAYYNYTDDKGSKNSRTTFGGRNFSRVMDKYTFKQLIPILGVDTTNNMVFNKAIVSAYTRDSRDKAVNNSKSGVSYAYDGSSANAGWYNCFTDSNTAYSTASLSSYKKNSNVTFGNNIVIDKYYPQMVWLARNIGNTGDKVDKKWHSPKAYASIDGKKHSLVLSIAGGHLRFSNWKAKETDDGSWNYCVDYTTLGGTTAIYKATASARIRDTSISTAAAMTQYPTMLYHSYRKGIYADKLILQYSTNKIKSLKDIFNLDSWIADAHVAVSFNFENMISQKKENYTSEPYFKDSNVPIETVWNNMYADSDRFKTYVTLNYNNNTVPNNSPLGNLLTSKNESGGRKYTIVSLGASISDQKNVSRKLAEGRRYMSVPLLDSTVDFGQAYKIWTSKSSDSAVKIAVDSTMTEPRSRKVSSYLYKGNGNGLSYDDGFFKWYRCMAGNNLGDTWSGDPKVRALRLFMTDQRVSDLLEDYPLEDFTLLSFVWLNYYIPQTPFSTKLSKLITDTTEVENSDNSDGSSSSSSSDSKEDNKDTKDDEEDEKAKASIQGKSNTKVFVGNNGGIYPDGTAITESSAYYGNKDNRNTIMWTLDLSDVLQYTLTAGSDGWTCAGTAHDLTTSQVNIEVVSVNFGSYLLSINKNTQGDALANIIDGYDEALGDIDDEYTQTFLDKILYFLEHPVLSLANIFLGFFQMIHNNIAVGNAGNVFDISWIIDWGIAKGFVKYYLVLSGIWVAAMLVIRCVKYAFNKESTLGTLFKESAVCILLTTVPVVLLYLASNAIHTMALYMTRDVASNLVLIEIEKEVTASESLNLNFESVYQMYREQFTDIDDSYVGLQFKQPTAWDSSKNELEYGAANIKTLYNSISYSNILAKSQTAAKLAEMSLEDIETSNNDKDVNKTGVYGLNEKKFDDAIKKMNDVYASGDGSANTGATYMYYTYNCFIPVNYNKYSSSIFYYFYDYIKYQYLSYWAGQTGSKKAAFADAAKQFSLPDAKHQELWSSYIARMWDAERGMLLKSYNGVYNMYHDDDYTYAKLYDANGKPAYSGEYTTDMFGLSYLFHMTADGNTMDKMGFVDNVYYNVIQGRYDQYNSTDYTSSSKKTSAGSITTWYNVVKDNFENSLNADTAISNNSDEVQGNYAGFLNRVSKCSTGKVSTISRPALLRNFYPIAYVMGGIQWQAMTHATTLLTDKPESDQLEDLKISPTYLEKTYGAEWYNKQTKKGTSRLYKDITDTKWINADSSHSSYLSSDDLDLSKLKGQRMYGRVYASRSVLYKHMFNGTELISTTITPLEEKLMDLNDNIYADVVKMTEYMQGDIRDSSLIFAAALAATFEFNKTFSGNPITGVQIEPQGLEPTTTDVDKYMRATFAENIDQIVKNNDVIYMIYEQDQGFVTAFFVILSEILILVTVITRCVILWVMFISAAYICLTFYFNPPYSRKNVIIGVLSQIASLLGGQFVVMFVVTRSLRIVGSINAGWGRVLVALLMCGAYLVVAIWNIKMLVALLKDIKTYGGAVISNVVSAARMNYETRRSHMQAQAVKLGKTTLKAGAIAMQTTPEELAQQVKERKQRRRARSAKRMGRYSEDNVQPDETITEEQVSKRRRRRKQSDASTASTSGSTSSASSGDTQHTTTASEEIRNDRRQASSTHQSNATQSSSGSQQPEQEKAHKKKAVGKSAPTENAKRRTYKVNVRARSQTTSSSTTQQYRSKH